MKTLPPGPKSILELVMGAHPDRVQFEEIDCRLKYKPNSRNSYLRILRSQNLVHISRGTVKASDNLFE